MSMMIRAARLRANQKQAEPQPAGSVRARRVVQLNNARTPMAAAGAGPDAGAGPAPAAAKAQEAAQGGAGIGKQQEHQQAPPTANALHLHAFANHGAGTPAEAPAEMPAAAAAVEKLNPFLHGARAGDLKDLNPMDQTRMFMEAMYARTGRRLQAMTYTPTGLQFEHFTPQGFVRVNTHDEMNRVVRFLQIYDSTLTVEICNALTFEQLENLYRAIHMIMPLKSASPNYAHLGAFLNHKCHVFPDNANAKKVYSTYWRLVPELATHLTFLDGASDGIDVLRVHRQYLQQRALSSDQREILVAFLRRVINDMTVLMEPYWKESAQRFQVYMVAVQATQHLAKGPSQKGKAEGITNFYREFSFDPKALQETAFFIYHRILKLNELTAQLTPNSDYRTVAAICGNVKDCETRLDFLTTAIIDRAVQNVKKLNLQTGIPVSSERAKALLRERYTSLMSIDVGLNNQIDALVEIIDKLPEGIRNKIATSQDVANLFLFIADCILAHTQKRNKIQTHGLPTEIVEPIRKSCKEILVKFEKDALAFNVAPGIAQKLALLVGDYRQRAAKVDKNLKQAWIEWLPMIRKPKEEYFSVDDAGVLANQKHVKLRENHLAYIAELTQKGLQVATEQQETEQIKICEEMERLCQIFQVSVKTIADLTATLDDAASGLLDKEKDKAVEADLALQRLQEDERKEARLQAKQKAAELAAAENLHAQKLKAHQKRMQPLLAAQPPGTKVTLASRLRFLRTHEVELKVMTFKPKLLFATAFERSLVRMRQSLCEHYSVDMDVVYSPKDIAMELSFQEQAHMQHIFIVDCFMAASQMLVLNQNKAFNPLLVQLVLRWGLRSLKQAAVVAIGDKTLAHKPLHALLSILKIHPREMPLEFRESEIELFGSSPWNFNRVEKAPLPLWLKSIREPDASQEVFTRFIQSLPQWINGVIRAQMRIMDPYGKNQAWAVMMQQNVEEAEKAGKAEASAPAQAAAAAPKAKTPPAAAFANAVVQPKSLEPLRHAIKDLNKAMEELRGLIKTQISDDEKKFLRNAVEHLTNMRGLVTLMLTPQPQYLFVLMEFLAPSTREFVNKMVAFLQSTTSTKASSRSAYLQEMREKKGLSPENLGSLASLNFTDEESENYYRYFANPGIANFIDVLEELSLRASTALLQDGDSIRHFDFATLYATMNTYAAGFANLAFAMATKYKPQK